MKKIFLTVIGVSLILGMNTNSLANENTKVPFGDTQENHNLSGFEGKVEFVSGRHLRGHRSGHFRGSRHRSHKFGHFRNHRGGFKGRHFGGRGFGKYYRPHLKPHNSYYNGGFFFGGRGIGGHKKFNNHQRGYIYGPYLFSGHK